MAKNEVGEFELVLGNKQLLTVFFIVVTLLGVFFTMGYIVGRNSGGAGTLEAANRKPPTVIEPAPPATPDQGLSPVKPEAKPESKKEEPAEAAPPPPVVETKPAEPSKAEEKKPEEPTVAEKKKDDKKSKKEKAAAEAPAPAPASEGAPSGTYLQLAAVPKAEADLLISVLRKKGFSATAGPGPAGKNLFRVLVGPLSGADAISKTRSSLDDAGMPGSKALIRRF